MGDKKQRILPNSGIVKRIEKAQNGMSVINPQIVANTVGKNLKVLDNLYNRSKPQVSSTYIYNPVINNIFAGKKIIESERNGGIVKRVESGKSGIHIKPENRGKLTRLKKRTGKSEAELWKEGDPAVRKMITFARNSRKWKHK